MKRLFLSPHDDDQVLFGAFTCLRYKPDVAIVTDSYIQTNRGELVDAKGRAIETENANKILGCKTIRLGIPDDNCTEEAIEDALEGLQDYDVIYAPEFQGGNIHHDMVNQVAKRVYGDKVIFYTTYTKSELWTKGETEIKPTPEELRLKYLAMDCYLSQIAINLPHFHAVYGKSEWLNHNVVTKCFILTQFGSPHSWTQEYIDHVQHLRKYGWYWKIFTSNDLESKGNVEVIKMSTDEFNQLVKDKLGIESYLEMSPTGVPNLHMTDYCVAWGLIFADYLKDFDFWGIPNWDIVYGRLDHFISDKLLEQTDVFTDDVNAINGIFCLWRNNEEINNLFKKIPDWEKKIGQTICPRCMGEGGNHVLYGTDEYDMTEVMKTVDVRYCHPQYYPIHSYDRLENHVPDVKLEIKEDGTLWEFLTDTNPPEWIHQHKQFGREIPYFHFIRTKEWPKCL